MQGLYCKLSPFTPDIAGAMALFADCSALVVPFDMNGSVSTFRNRVGVEDNSPVRVVSALGARQVEYVMGDAQAFAQEVAHLRELYGGEFIVLLPGPVAAMAGIDLEALASQMSEELGCRVVGINCTGNAAYDEGLSKAMLAVFKQVKAVMPGTGAVSAELERKGVNLLGLNRVDHNDAATHEYLIERVCAATGEDIVSIWGVRDSWPQWERAVLARENIVMSASAMKLAQAVEREWGIPYRRVDEVLGCEANEQRPRAACDGGRVLVVHEQLAGNLIRNMLEAHGFEANVASFHKTLPAARRDDDVRLKGEADFEQLLATGAYDALVGDPALEACMPRGLKFVPCEHSAVAHILASERDCPAALTKDWQRYALRLLGVRRSDNEDLIHEA